MWDQTWNFVWKKENLIFIASSALFVQILWEQVLWKINLKQGQYPSEFLWLWSQYQRKKELAFGLHVRGLVKKT